MSSSSACRRRSTRHREPDLSFVEDTARAIAAASAQGPARRARIDDLSRHDARGREADPRSDRVSRAATTSSSASRPSARIPAMRSSRRRRSPRSLRATAPTRRKLVEAFYGAVVKRVVPVSSTGRRRGRQDHREHLSRRQHRARQRAQGRSSTRWASTSGR